MSQKLILVDSFLVEVDYTQEEHVGSIIVVETSPKVLNYGRVLITPAVISKKAQDDYKEVFDSVRPNDTVFFSTKVGYEMIESEQKGKNHKWLIIPVHHILGISKS